MEEVTVPNIPSEVPVDVVAPPTTPVELDPEAVKAAAKADAIAKAKAKRAEEVAAKVAAKAEADAKEAAVKAEAAQAAIDAAPVVPTKIRLLESVHLRFLHPSLRGRTMTTTMAASEYEGEMAIKVHDAVRDQLPERFADVLVVLK